MLGALFCLGVLGVSFAKAAWDNYDMKSSSSHYDEKGNLHYYDSNLKEYINGERVQRVSNINPDGATLYSTVGMKTNKVYNVAYGRGTQQLLDLSEKRKQDAIKWGDLAYTQYNPYFGEFVTTEIATGKTITCLWAGYNHITKENFYRKWYFRPECQGKFDYNKTVEGDMGIEITEEEYKKLDVITPSFRNLPSDPEVEEKLDRYHEYLELRAEQNRKERERK